MTPQILDNIVYVEIPDEYVLVKLEDWNGYKTIKDPLYDLVGSFMLHLNGPCGPDSPFKGCTKERYCRYLLPKKYISITEICEDKYSLYKRRHLVEGGKSIIKNKRRKKNSVHNTDMVPYNKYILYKHTCHISIEHFYSVVAIKYLFEYIY